jgi:hypothetical protein
LILFHNARYFVAKADSVKFTSRLKLAVEFDTETAFMGGMFFDTSDLPMSGDKGILFPFIN